MTNQEPYNPSLDHPDYFDSFVELPDEFEGEPQDFATKDIVSKEAAIVFVLFLLTAAVFGA